uniref:Uncharacterized protein n=1 Tax=Clytia hemisphaerica TaxID=252671 RepID=A0A7M5WZ95_9CNID
MKTITALLFLLAAQANAQTEINLRREQNMCSVWGSGHYQTFDGTTFNYPGQCTYALAIDCRPGKDDFAVHIENGVNCTAGKSCSRAVVVYLNDIPHRISFDSTFTKDGKKVTLPYADQDVAVSRHAGYTYLDAWNGKLLVKYDGNNGVYVQVGDEFHNGAVCGLCGNNNGPTDDFLKPGGQQAKNPTEYGNSWAKPIFGQTCKQVIGEVDYCNGTKDLVRLLSETKCKELKRSEVFTKCRQMVNPEPYYKACVQEACKCQGDHKCTCGAFEQYSRECLRHGITANWRSEDQCPVQCTDGKVFMECGPSCSAECGQKGVISNCKTGCIDGCHCPKGTVLSKGVCIPETQCPCLHNGNSYNHGVTVKMPGGCKNCTCNGGEWDCNNMECDGTASLYGNGHYNTFDGKSFSYRNTCPSILVSHRGKAPFSVITDRQSCASKTCYMTIIIVYKTNQIKLSTELGKFLASVNDLGTKLPIVSNKGFRVEAVSSMIRIETTEGLRVTWDGKSRVNIKIPPSFKNQVSGLLGNFNGKTIDDFTEVSGDLAHSEIEFGNSWLLPSKCKPLSSTDFSLTPCEANHQNAQVAETKCDILNSGPFKKCHAMVDTVKYFDNCKQDVCGCGNHGSECFCAVLSAYAAECAMAGVEMKGWRKTSGCEVTCPVGQSYQECSSSCTHSCSDVITPDAKCNEDCIEGCACPKGMVKKDDISNVCVAKTACGCQVEDKLIANGGRVQKGCNTCVCREGSLVCTTLKCKSDIVKCKPDMVYTTCLPTCPNTCATKQLGQTCLADKQKCVSGCTCPDGTIEHDGKCITPEQCPCFHDGKTYEENSKMSRGCNDCICKSGKWKCTEDNCPGVCSVFGDPHYKTFDGKIFDYQGRCKHTMVSDTCAGQPSKYKKEQIHVEVNTQACGSQEVTCAKEITAIIHGSTFILKKGDKKAVIKPALEDKPTFKVYDYAGSYVHIVTDHGISLMWDNGTRLYITVQPALAGKLCGLCGNYDGSEANDFVTIQGDTTASATIFGDSWADDDSCPKAKEIEDTCKARPHRLDPSKKECSIIKSDVFKQCHHAVDPSIYYDRCVFDVCGCDQLGDCDCICDAVGAYQKACQDEGIYIGWRKGHSICEKEMCCPTNMTYQIKGQACPPTCQYPKGDPNCPTKFVEGCQCPVGMVQKVDRPNGNVFCVPPSECVYCEMNGHRYIDGERVPHKPGTAEGDETEITNPDCQECVCNKGKVVCKEIPGCTSTTVAPSTTTITTISSTTQPQSTTESPTTESSTTPSQSTTESSTTPSQSTTEASTTKSQTTKASTTKSQTTAKSSTTQPQTTEEASTTPSKTESSTTPSQSTTEASTTKSQTTTEASTTKSQTTKASTTKSQTTESSTTKSQTTAKSSTTQPQTTEEASTTPSKTESSTTPSQSTTEASTTKSQTTENWSTTPSQTTESSTTKSQSTTEASTTPSQTTTEAPITQPQSTTEASTTSSKSTTESSTTSKATEVSTKPKETGTTVIATQSTEGLTTREPFTPETTSTRGTFPTFPTFPPMTTKSSTTKSSTTSSRSTTEALTTPSQSTESQTTEASTTPSQTTESQTTEQSTTVSPTTVSPTTAPICDCKNPLPVGVSNEMIPDSQMKTNSIRSPEPGPANTGPAQARLNNRQSIHGSGAWEPKDKEAHLDIIFNKMEDVREIRTQGSPRDERFARRYFVFYSLDGESFENEPLQSPEGSYIFEGNNDNNGIKVNKLNIKAKAIRIVPANDESIGEPQVAMRVELYVCPPCSTTPAPPVTTTQSTTTVRISTNIYTEPPLTTEPQVKETTTEQSTTESSTTESQTTESSTTESPTTKSSTTQSQTTPEASTIPSQSTTEASTTEAATTQSQTTPETSTTQSTIPTTVTTPIVTTSPQCPSMQVYSTNCTSEYHCDSREMCQPVQYAGCCCPNGGYKIGDMCVPQKNECPCVNNGIVKAPGETWKPNDHEFCRCNGDTQECVPTCPESLKCKPYEKKIFTGPSEDGECCKCVPSCQYCKIGSHKYVPIGEKWSISRDENSCVEGQCLLDEDGECAILEKDQIICEKPCPKDMKRSTNGTCCDCEPTTQVSTTPSTTEASTTIESSTTKSQSTTESSTTQSQSTTEAATTPSQTTESSTTPSQTTGSSTTQSQTTTKLSTTQSQTTTKSSTTQSQTTTESPTTKSSTTRSQTTESSTTQSQSTTESPTTKSSTTQSQTTEAATTPLQTTESSTTQSQTTEASTTKSSTVESKSTTESSTTESPTTPSQTTKSLTTSSQTTESQTTESSTTKSSTMLPTTPTCDCKNLLPVGVSDGRIPDSQMKSNSVRVTSPGPFNTGPAQARLNNKLTSSGSGAWEPKDKEAHLDIIFNKMEDVREIRTQGSPRINRFAKRFFVFYSLDGENFEQEPLPSPDGSPIFEGNTDNNGIKVNKLNIKAKAIRIVPANDESIGEPKVAMRVEFYVCPPCFTTPLPPVTTPQSTTTVGKSTNIYTEPPQSTEPQVGETTTKASTTQSQSTKESSTTPSQSTKASTTQSQTTAEASTTQSQTTEASTTEDLTTKSSTTKSSTTQSQSTTEASTTPSQTTEASTTQSQTTEASTTKSQTTEASTTQSQTTAEFSTTEASTTKSKTTKSSTTSSQTTKSQTTESSTTKSSTMSPTTPTCDCKNLLPVGVSDGRIPDSQMKSNSIKVSNPGQVYTGPAEARLNNKLTSSGSGAWEPKDKEAHLDIIFNKMEDVREIRTQGSPRHNRFATRYFVFYSLNGVNFEQEPLISADGSPVFEGNTNNNGIKVNKLNIKAKAIRIVPGNDESIGEPLVAMRVEFYVCPPCSTTPAPPVTTRQSSTTQSQTTEESSTTPSQTTTESSTTQSQTTSEGSTTPSKTTTESQSTTESPTEGSTTPKPKECTVKETKIKIKHQECISKEEITVASCSGSCQSSATFSAEPPFFSQDCTCCKPTEFIDVQVPMTCMRTRPTSMIIKKIAKCICSRCDSEAVIPTQHPTQGDAINPDDISNEPVVSKARRKRSITERLYDMVFGQ